MSVLINKYGLTRYIPENIKREIRQNSGFGCVICGLGIHDYEHVEPEFNDVKAHDPACMTLLCSQCHTKVTRGFLSKETVKQAMADPKALQKGFANEFFDVSNSKPLEIIFGGNKFINIGDLLVLNGEVILKILPPVIEKSPVLLSGRFYNPDDKLSLEVKDNEWLASTQNWDVTVIGKKMTFKDESKKTHLELIVNPPNSIAIARINMNHSGYSVTGDDKTLAIEHSSKPGKNLISFSGCEFGNSGIHCKASSDNETPSVTIG